MVRPGILVVHVRFECRQAVSHAAGKNRILQTHSQLIFRDVLQNGHGIVIQVLPSARGEFLKYFLTFLVPCPPQIPGKSPEAIEKARSFVRVEKRV